MEFESSGEGYLVEPSGARHSVRYYVHSYLERPDGLYDSYGRIDPDDNLLLMRLMIESAGCQLILELQDGSKLPVLLTSSSGSVRVQGSLEPAAR